MKNNVFRYKRISWFTLVELIFVVLIIWLVMPAMFALYDFIVRSNTEIEARQETIQQWYEFFERLNILMQDYTIDYEEYYNRQMVWCVAGWETGSNFTWNIWLSGYCTEFTAYGNENSTKISRPQRNISSWYHDIYYCSSDHENSSMQGDDDHHLVIWRNDCWRIWSKQSYGQYEALFTDVGIDTDYRSEVGHERIWDSDDKNLGRTLPISTWTLDAIQDANHIQELYFISHDWKSRLYFRRSLVNTWNTYTQYKIQMLRLRGFDAWQKHDFDATSDNEWLYDWKIDTWACDAWMWFEPEDKEGRTSIGWAYAEYYMPATVDDCWIDLTHWSTTISAWNIIISPVTDSDLAWAEQKRQVNAYMKILTVNWIYAPYYATKLSESIKDFKVPLETIINMKDFYRE